MAFGADRRRTGAIVGTTLVTAALVYAGTGLAPVWWLTWLVPLPALLLAPRVPARVAALVAGLGWGAGGLNMWSYEWQRLELPPPILIAQIAAPGLLFALAVLPFRALVLRSRPLWAALSVPALWVSAEYLLSVSTPNGAFWSLAYTQADVGRVVQLAALSGGWGITFLVTAVPAGIAAALAPGQRARVRLHVGMATALLLAASVGYGVVRLAGAERPGSTYRVALLAAGQQNDWAPLDTARGREKLAAALSRLRALPAGTRAAVLPEGAFVTTTATLPIVVAPLSALARELRLDIVAGVLVLGDDANYNAAMFFPADGTGPLTYRKQHLVPGVEPYRPGHELLFVPDRDPLIGVAICKDLDFPSLARAYRRGGAELMLTPAWDFEVDGRLHARMAVVRGVENGFSLVRSAADGNLTVSDPYGRVLAEDTTRDRDLVTVTATVPTAAESTRYTRWGDWSAWLSIALTGALAVWLLGTAGRARRRPGPTVSQRPGPTVAQRPGPTVAQRPDAIVSQPDVGRSQPAGVRK